MSLGVKILTIFWFNLYSSYKIFHKISKQESKLSWFVKVGGEEVMAIIDIRLCATREP